jgi:DNA-binding CsgD family transcriptional regulator
MSTQYDLSNREIEILELLAHGTSNKEIATRLVISTNTVKVHLRNIYTKLGVSSRTEAVMTALRENLIDVEGIATSDLDGITTGAMGDKEQENLDLNNISHRDISGCDHKYVVPHTWRASGGFR